MNRDNTYLMGNKFAKGNKPNKTAFGKGHVPWNKGLKGIHLSPKTEFKKGHKTMLSKPIGYKTIRIDKSGKKRRWIKTVEPNHWIEYAKYVWIKHNGEIPNSYLIHHIDKNTLNDNIENLALLTRKDHINIHREDLLANVKDKSLYFRWNNERISSLRIQPDSNKSLSG